MALLSYSTTTALINMTILLECKYDHSIRMTAILEYIESAAQGSCSIANCGMFCWIATHHKEEI